MKAESEKNMTVSGHLRELRNRIVICVLCLIVSFLIGLNFSPDIVELLTGIGEQYGYVFVYIAPQELLLQYFSVALIVGLCITLPVIFYHVWAFIQPGLRKNENMLFLGAIISGLICFVIGVTFAYRLMLPFMLRFLIKISEGSKITASVSVANYLTFMFTIFIVFGIIFELPVVSILLTQMGLLKISWMKKGQRVVIVVIFFISAIVTPPDIISQCMVAFPMIGLYELSILLCSILLKFKKKKKTDEEEENEDDENNDD